LRLRPAAKRNFLALPDKTNPPTWGRLRLIEVVLLRARHVCLSGKCFGERNMRPTDHNRIRDDTAQCRFVPYVSRSIE